MLWRAAAGRRDPLFQLPKKTRPLPRVTGHTVAERVDFDQHGVVVAVDEDPLHLEPVPGRLALGPQLAARAAEERGEAGLAGLAQRFVVHEADYQHLAGAIVLDDRRNESIELRKVHDCPVR